MKTVLISAVVFVLLSHVLSASIPEIEPSPKTRADNFEDEIFYLFNRFQAFFDRTNYLLRTVRLDHVDLTTSIYNRMIQMYGSELDLIRRASVELDEAIEQRIADLGGPNDCIREAITERNRISETVTRELRVCSIRANQTMESQIQNVFYPIFADIQGQAFDVEVIVMDALSRGNVMVEEQEILDYLLSQYEFYTNLWPKTINQLLQWDQTRFRVEGEFLIEQTVLCVSPPTTRYITSAAILEYRVEMC